MGTTPGTRSTITAVNVDPADALAAHAVLAVVFAQAVIRDHLRGSVQSFVYDADQGLNVIVRDSGQRQHLANALGLPPGLVPVVDPNRGTLGHGRRGDMLNVRVTIWSVVDGEA